MLSVQTLISSKRWGDKMSTEEEIRNVLKQCYDPEIPVNIVDLGLVYGIEVKDKKVQVKMTLTAPGCPLAGFIVKDVEKKLKAIPGVDEADVQLVWDPPWSPDRMSDNAKKTLGFTR